MTIKNLEAVPATITADTEIAIPGHYIAQGDKKDRWVIRRTSDGKPVKMVRVKW